MGAAQRPDKAIAVTCMCDVKQQNQTQTIKTTTNDFFFFLKIVMLISEYGKGKCCVITAAQCIHVLENKMCAKTRKRAKCYARQSFLYIHAYK